MKKDMNSEGTYNPEEYDRKVHLIGRISLIVGVIVTASFPLVLWLRYGLIPESKILLMVFINISSVMLPAAIIELLSYTPIVGASSMYIMTLTGSYLSMRLPSAVNAMEANEVSAGSEEGDVISTVAMVSSVFVSITIIAIGVFLMVPLQPVFQLPVLQPAFDTVIMAVMGAFTISVALKNLKPSILPLTMAFLAMKFNLIPSMVIMPSMVILSLVGNRILYKKGLLQ
jgi:hypothetical protein